jgi:GntR family transcriptional regulator, transcriptional repressor for pyruvate dehydrogenase complex
LTLTNETLLPITPREAPSVEIARRLLRYLLSGQIKPGDRLPSERQLAVTLAVGRSSVRDALRPLLLLGILETRQGDGTYLRQAESMLLPQAVEWGLLLGDHATFDLVEARTYVEIALAELAAIRRTDADLERAQAALERMASEGVTSEAFIDADLAFHLSVGQASGNLVLFGTLQSIQSLLRVWITRVLATSSRTRWSYEEHVPIFEAIKRGDPAAAAAAMTVHMRSATTRLTETLDIGPAGSRGGSSDSAADGGPG